MTDARDDRSGLGGSGAPRSEPPDSEPPRRGADHGGPSREEPDRAGREASDALPAPGPGLGVEELRRRALAFGFAVVTLVILALLLAIYWQLARPILWAVTLAVLFYPLHRLVVRGLRGRESVGAFVSTVAALAVVFIPSVFVVVRLVGEVHSLWPVMQDGFGPGGFERLARLLEESRFRGLAHVLTGGDPGGGAGALQAKLQDMAFAVQDFLLQRLRVVTRNLPGALVQMGITVVAFYFFLRSGPAWVRGLQGALPLERHHAARLFGIAAQSINVVFRGVLLTAAAQALAAGLGYWVAGAPLPVLLSVLTFVAAVIPVVGAAAVWVPVAVGLYAAGHPSAAIGLAIYGAFFVSLLDNVMRPLIIGRGMRLPLLWLFLAIVGGLKLFGFLGLVAGPMVLSLAMAVYRIYREGWRETTEGTRAPGLPRVDPTARH
jgi:predicted PurR-regulated permease PerM